MDSLEYLLKAFDGMGEPVLFPVEIWCQIFPYMDEASIRNASAACKLFFEIVRGSEKYSGHVKIKQIDLSQLVMKIKSEEWTWQRWPCLKTLEIPIQLEYPAPTYKDWAGKKVTILKSKFLMVKSSELFKSFYLHFT